MRSRITFVLTAIGLAGLLLVLSLLVGVPAAADQSAVARPSAPRIPTPPPLRTTATAPSTDPDPALPSPQPQSTLAARPRVLVLGDSLTHSAHQQLTAALSPVAGELHIQAWGGTAPCDWIGPVADEVGAFEPHLVLIEFAGNDLTPCIAETPRGTAGFLDRYRTASRALTEAAAASGAVVRWMALPPMADRAHDAIARQLNELYRSLSHEGVLTPVRAALTIDGGFGFTDACRSELECGPAAIGSRTRVRSDDGLHLAPAGSARMAERYRTTVTALTTAPRSQ